MNSSKRRRDSFMILHKLIYIYIFIQIIRSIVLLFLSDDLSIKYLLTWFMYK